MLRACAAPQRPWPVRRGRPPRGPVLPSALAARLRALQCF